MNTESVSILWVVIIIVGLIISIAMIVAILKIPKIARYERSILKLTALMAKKQGVKSDLVEQALNEADAWILAENDNRFEKELSNVQPS
jgi:hypothetical protein